MSKKQVSLEELKRTFEYLSIINRTKLEDIEWTINGKVVPVSQEQIDFWNTVGLNSPDFDRQFYQPD